MWKFVLVLLTAALLLSGIPDVPDDVSASAVTQVDRQWVFNTTQDLNTISSTTEKVPYAYRNNDYEALDDFGKAIIEGTSHAVEDSKTYNVSNGMLPAKRAWEDSMKNLNNAGWELRIYAKSNGTKPVFWDRFQESEQASSDLILKYIKYK